MSKRHVQSENEKAQTRGFVDICDALNQIGAKVAFINNSVPLTMAGCGFSEEALCGLGYVLSSIQDDVDAAREVLKTLKGWDEVQNELK